VRRQNARIEPGRIDVDVVAERDLFVCHICNELVDMSLPRTSKMGATLDHVFPLSLGGDDSMENVKLAHWICNVKKSNKLETDNG
jgi:5-methylcytosine-specific restriction endonuclease McrA